ncbi:MAG: hypothetical protein IRZ00_20825, partial [Gemmatimonadetes bacterium]|nr:hypothetical protein [Gemmatimonadota bacterium]
MSEPTSGRVLESQPRLLQHLFSSAPRWRQPEDVPSLLLSLVLHACLVLFVWLGREHLALTPTDAGVGTGHAAGAAGGGGGGGSEEVSYVELVTPAAAPAPKPEPVPEPPPPPNVTPMLVQPVLKPAKLAMPLPSELSIVAPKAVLGAPAPMNVAGTETGSGGGT